ncbi:MAG: hypothetical protein QXX51_05385 [Candidatus Bathyarchaeia archaeon]
MTCLSTFAEEKCLKRCCGASLRTDKSLGGENGMREEEEDWEEEEWEEDEEWEEEEW